MSLRHEGCSPASGSTFPLGVNVLSTFTFHVTVIDTTAPALTLPENLSVTTPDANGAVATYTATASDLVDGNRNVTCNPASGIWVEAVEGAGNCGIGAVNVSVPHDQGNSSTARPAKAKRRSC